MGLTFPRFPGLFPRPSPSKPLWQNGFPFSRFSRSWKCPYARARETIKWRRRGRRFMRICASRRPPFFIGENRENGKDSSFRDIDQKTTGKIAGNSGKSPLLAVERPILVFWGADERPARAPDRVGRPLGAFAADLDAGERLARLRSLRAIAHLCCSPRGDVLAYRLRLADRDANRLPDAVAALNALAALDRRRALASARLQRPAT